MICPPATWGHGPELCIIRRNPDDLVVPSSAGAFGLGYEGTQ